MALTITAQGNEPIPTGDYRVELTAIELSTGQYGEQLKWTLHVPDKGRNLEAYSSLSASLASKCMKVGRRTAGTPRTGGRAGGLRGTRREDRYRCGGAQAQGRRNRIQRD